MLNNLPDIRKIYNNLRNSARRRGIEFNIRIGELYYLSYPITCPILGIPLKFNKGRMEDNSYSIDRIDNDRGYSIDNIMVISYKANRAKNNLNKEEIKKLINFVEE